MTLLSRPAALSDEVCRLLATRIRSGELGPGARLPTEKSLGDTLGVSRAWCARLSRGSRPTPGESRQGSAAFVAAPGSASFRLRRARTRIWSRYSNCA